LKVVSASTSGFVPTPGSDLVVLKHAQSGLVFDRVIPDGQPVEQGKWLSRIFKNDAEYVCYVVNRDPHLQHNFSTQIEHTSHGHSFGLDYVLMFSISNPRTIVERLNDDPVRKLELTVKGTVDAEARKIGWEKLSSNVLGSAGEDLTKDILDRRLSGLQEFAGKYGIALQSVELMWHLGAEEVADIQAEVKGKKTKKLAEIRTDTAKTELVSQHELDVLKAQQDAEINAIKRREQLYDIALEKTGVALHNVADKINTAEGLRHVYEVVRETALDHGQQAGLPAHKSGSALTAGEPERTGFAIGSIIDEALRQTQSLSCTASDKRQLLSCVLHLIAECYVDSSSDQKRLDEYIEVIRKIVSRTSRPLSPEQYSYFRRTLDVDALKNQLQ
jgi:hypothetical protein